MSPVSRTRPISARNSQSSPRPFVRGARCPACHACSRGRVPEMRSDDRASTSATRAAVRAAMAGPASRPPPRLTVTPRLRLSRRTARIPTSSIISLRACLRAAGELGAGGAESVEALRHEVLRPVALRRSLAALPGPEELLALVAIVRATSEREILGRCRTTAGKRGEVVKLQMPHLGASSARPDECATSLVPGPHVTADRSRDMPCASRRRRTTTVCAVASLWRSLLPRVDQRAATVPVREPWPDHRQVQHDA